MKQLFELFIAFTKIGAVTFGGGYAMLPILQLELSVKRHWVTDEDLADYFAIGQCTPGIIAVNTATFVGYKRKGIPGAIVATLGLVFPSIVILILIAAFLKNFADILFIRQAFAGVRVGVCVLILNSVIRMWKTSITDRIGLVIFAVVFILAMFTGVSLVLLVLASGVCGIAVGFLRKGAGT